MKFLKPLPRAWLALCFSTLFLSAQTIAPDWWNDYNVLIGEAEDDKIALQGQGKYMASKAHEAMESILYSVGGSGTEISNLVNSFSTDHNYDPLLMGQLKYIADPYYRRLDDLGIDISNVVVEGIYPWTSTTADDVDTAPSLLGQLKYVFSFDISLLDSDLDGISDSIEMSLMGTLEYDAESDPDQDGLTVQEEIDGGTNPIDSDTDNDGKNDRLEIVQGTDPLVEDSFSFSSLPFSEYFYQFDAGTFPNSNGWSSAGAGVATISNQIAHSDGHSLLLDSSLGDVSVINEFSSKEYGVVWIDFHLLPFLSNVAQDPLISQFNEALFYFDDQGRLQVFDGISQEWGAAIGVPTVTHDHWVRVTLRLDYAKQTWKIWINGGSGATNMGFANPVPYLSRFEYRQSGQGSSYLDSIVITNESPNTLGDNSLDYDSDGIPDSWEYLYFNSIAYTGSDDLDEDGLSNLEEYENNTLPYLNDSDGDGLNDGYEVAYQSDPNDPMSVRVGFEYEEGFSLGLLNDQVGWISDEDSSIVSATSFDSTQSLALGAVDGKASSTLASESGNASQEVWTSLYAKLIPGEYADPYSGGEVSATAFQLNSDGYLCAFDGIQNTWLVSDSFVGPNVWTRYDVKISNSKNTWDLYAQGKLVFQDLPVATSHNASSDFSIELKQLYSLGDSNAYVDEIEVGVTHPKVIDFDEDDLPDDWEIAQFGTTDLYTGEDDPDEDGYINRIEYLSGTNPLSVIDSNQVVSSKIGINEAENFLLANFEVSKSESASNSEWASLIGSGGNLRTLFDDVDGIYTLEIAYLDSSDGSTNYALFIDETQVLPSWSTSWVADEEGRLFKTKTFHSVPINNGQELVIAAVSDGNESTAIDYVRITDSQEAMAMAMGEEESMALMASPVSSPLMSSSFVSDPTLQSFSASLSVESTVFSPESYENMAMAATSGSCGYFRYNQDQNNASDWPQAECFSWARVAHQPIGNQSEGILQYCFDGEWVAFDNFVFGEQIGADVYQTHYIEIVASCGDPSGYGNIEVRKGSANGQLLGVVSIPFTGGFDQFNTYATELEAVTGTDTLYLVFEGNRSALYDIDRFNIYASPSSNQEFPRCAFGEGTGLKYKYFEGSFSSADDLIGLSTPYQGEYSNFSLDARNDGRSGRNDYYGLTFEGRIGIPQSGYYTFTTISDDGTKLYVNDQLVVNNDGFHGSVPFSSSQIYLEQGYKDIRLDYFQGSGGQDLQVLWETDGLPQEAIPNCALYLPLGGDTVNPCDGASSSDGLKVTYYEGSFSSVDQVEGTTSLSVGITTNVGIHSRHDASASARDDNYGLVFEAFLNIPVTGDYRFYLTSDDGSKLYIDDQLVVDHDGVHGGTEKQGDLIHLSKGLHDFKLLFFQGTGGQTLQVSWSTDGMSKMAVPDCAFTQPPLVDIEFDGPNCVSGHSVGARIEAENYCRAKGAAGDLAVSGDKVVKIKRGNWLRFDNVDFSSGADEFELIASTTWPSDTIYVNMYIGTLDNLILSNYPINYTGGFENMQSHGVESFVCQKHATPQPVFLEIVSVNDQYIVDLDYFRFSSSGSGDCEPDDPGEHNGPCDGSPTVGFYIEAEDYCSGSGVTIEAGLSGWSQEMVTNIEPGDWIRFTDVDFSAGADHFEAGGASAQNNLTFNVKVIKVLSGGIEEIASEQNFLVHYQDNPEGRRDFFGALEMPCVLPGTYDVLVTFNGPQNARDMLLLDFIKFTNSGNCGTSSGSLCSGSGDGLHYDYYTHAGINSVYELSSLTPVIQGAEIDNFDITQASDADNFAYHFYGVLEVPISGSYQFTLRSDDGSVLLLNGQEVVNFDGQHVPDDRTESIYLEQGVALIDLWYFDNTGSQEFSIKWAGPDFIEEAIPNCALYKLATSGFDPFQNSCNPGQIGVAHQAENFCEGAGIGTNSIVGTADGVCLAHVRAADGIPYAVYRDFNFGSKYSDRISLIAATVYNGGYIEIRDGGLNGPLIGTIEDIINNGTYSASGYATNEAALDIPLTGVKDLYFVFHGDYNGAYDIDYFIFNERPPCNFQTVNEQVYATEQCELSGDIAVAGDNSLQINKAGGSVYFNDFDLGNQQLVSFGANVSTSRTDAEIEVFFDPTNGSEVSLGTLDLTSGIAGVYSTQVFNISTQVSGPGKLRLDIRFTNTADETILKLKWIRILAGSGQWEPNCHYGNINDASPILATDFCDLNGHVQIKDDWTKLQYICHNDWVLFEDFDFGNENGGNFIEFTYTSGPPSQGGNVLIYAVDPATDDGNPLAHPENYVGGIPLHYTNGWEVKSTLSTFLNESISGLKNIYFVFTHNQQVEAQPMVDFISFKFQYIQPNSVFDGWQKIINKEEPLAMAVDGSEYRLEGLDVVQKELDDIDFSQHWKFSLVGKIPGTETNLYKIIPRQVKSPGGNELALDVVRGMTTNHTQLQVYDYLGNAQQKWIVNKVESNPDYYTIEPYHTKSINENKVIDMVRNEESSDESGTPLQLYDETGGDNQKWSIEPVETEFTARSNQMLVNKSTNKLMTVDDQGNDIDDGLNIAQFSQSADLYQNWDINTTDSNYFTINLSGYSNYVVDAIDQVDGNIQLFSQQFDGGNTYLNQQWSFTQLDDGSFKILNRSISNQAIEVHTNDSSEGANIKQSGYQGDQAGNDHQRWQLLNFPSKFTGNLLISSLANGKHVTDSAEGLVVETLQFDEIGDPVTSHYWRFLYLTDGSYAIQSVVSGELLTKSGNVSNNGDKEIILTEFRGVDQIDDTQKWEFAPYQVLVPGETDLYKTYYTITSVSGEGVILTDSGETNDMLYFGELSGRNHATSRWLIEATAPPPGGGGNDGRPQIAFDPLDPDRDDMPTTWEIANGLNPLVNDALEDMDNDGFPNVFEYFYNSNPRSHDPQYADSRPATPTVTNVVGQNGIDTIQDGLRQHGSSRFIILQLSPDTYAGDGNEDLWIPDGLDYFLILCSGSNVEAVTVRDDFIVDRLGASAFSKSSSRIIGNYNFHASATYEYVSP